MWQGESLNASRRWSRLSESRRSDRLFGCHHSRYAATALTHGYMNDGSGESDTGTGVSGIIIAVQSAASSEYALSVV